MAIQFLYMTLAANKLNEHGLSNTAHCERLPKKTKVMGVLATERLPHSTNKSECLNYKSEWANT